MKRAVIATAGVLLVWIVQDILVWQRFFEARGLFQYDQPYQFWHQAFLFLLIAAGAAWVRGGWAMWFAVATWTLTNSGLADVLYYWLDFRAIPENLPWLDTTHPLIWFHPATSGNVVASSLIWVAIWAATLIVLRMARWDIPKAAWGSVR